MAIDVGVKDLKAGSTTLQAAREVDNKDGGQDIG